MNIPLPPSSIEVLDMVRPRVLRVWDIEIYVNYLLIKFFQPITREFTKFEIRVINGVVLMTFDRNALMALLNTSELVGFNSKKFDEPILAGALAGWQPAQLKQLTAALIPPGGGQGMMPWEIERQFGLQMPTLDHIDLIEVAPGQASLKAYGGKLHCKRLQDLPIEHTAVLTWEQMDEIDEYCENDLTTTDALRCKFQTQIDLRREMTAQYGIDLRSKSDAQIAEALFKKQLPFKVEVPYIPPGTQYFYKPPAWLKFITPQMQAAFDLVLRSPFTINEKGAITPTKELAATIVTIGKAEYQMGYGGLHSCEHIANYRADEDYSLRDIDVASYYPRTIIVQELCPPQIGRPFLDIFTQWTDQRVAAKRAGKKKQADGEKTKINGTFGKTGSRYSILHAPSMMIQVTITGQLGLLMLIELMETAGITIVQGNTDGIVTYCPRHLHGLRDMIVAYWEAITGYETEAVDYVAVFSRDVNNYMAFKEGGGVKLKGEAFAPPEPVGPSWPNPTAEICVNACIAYILDGTPIAQTIRQCADIRKFVSVRKVAGGGEWRPGPGEQGQYLGKAVRWYYATGNPHSSINSVTSGNTVAKSTGSKPCMTLPDILPPDIDYAWYVAETNEKLRSIGL